MSRSRLRRPTAAPFALAAMVFAGSIGSSHAAGDAGAAAEGRALFDEAVALMHEKNFTAACPKLEASLQKYPGIGTRGKLAECYEAVGRYVSAWRLYEQVAQLATQSGEPVRERVASERAKALEPKLSYLTVELAPTNDASGLVVTRNGRQIDRSRFGAAEPVDAGTYVLSVTAAGKKPVTAQLDVVAGQRARFVVPALEPAAEAASPAIYTEPPEAAPPSDKGWLRPAGLALGGVGVVGLVAGGIFGLSARSTYEGAFDDGRCDRSTNQCDVAGQRAVDDARSKATVSTIFVIGGGVCAALGAVLYFTAPKASSRRALQVAPAAYAGGAGIVAAGAL